METKYYHNGDIKQKTLIRDDITIEIRYSIRNKIDEVRYYKDNKLHNNNSKAAYFKFDTSGNIIIKIYYLNGKCHRDNDLPAYIKYGPTGFVKEKKYFIHGEIRRLDSDQPTHLVYHKNSEKIKYEKYKSHLYFTFSVSNPNLPMNISVDNNLLHRSNNKPALTKYYKSGNIHIEIYYNKGKIHNYTDYAKIIYDKDGNIKSADKVIDNRLSNTNPDYIKNWSKMFARNIA